MADEDKAGREPHGGGQSMPLTFDNTAAGWLSQCSRWAEDSLLRIPSNHLGPAGRLLLTGQPPPRLAAPAATGRPAALASVPSQPTGETSGHRQLPLMGGVREQLEDRF